MYLKVNGLVLRSTEYKDADSILTVLTKEHGLMTLKARGVRRNSSSLKSACQLLTYAEFTVNEMRGFHSITEASPIEMFVELRDDIELLSLASYFAQAAEVLSQEDSPDPAMLTLTLNSLYALGKLHKPQDLVKAAFELRAACLAGFFPELQSCAVCGGLTPDRFSVSGGAAVCSTCRGVEGLRLPMSASTLAAMRYIVGCDAKRLFSFELTGPSRKELADLAETYLVTQLERGFYTLDFYKSLKLI